METGCHVMSPSGPNLSLADAHVIDASRLIDTVNQGGAALAAAKAGVGEAHATVADTQSNLARLQQVYKLSGGKVPSKTELDAGRANYSRAMASVRSAEAQVLQARAQLATAQTNLDKARIYSPVNGVVLSRDRKSTRLNSSH